MERDSVSYGRWWHLSFFGVVWVDRSQLTYVSGQVYDGVQERWHVGEPGGENANKDSDVEDVENSSEQCPLQSKRRWSCPRDGVLGIFPPPFPPRCPRLGLVRFPSSLIAASLSLSFTLSVTRRQVGF